MQQNVKTVLQLRQMILDGKFSGGERLSEPNLTKCLDASRTPVRMALVTLENEGLVERLPSGGYQVRVFSERDVFDAIELRGSLEGLCARFAAERRPARRECDALQRAVERIDEVLVRRQLSEDDFMAYMQANEQIHRQIVEMAHSTVLAQEMQRVAAKPFASPSAFVMAQSKIPASRDILTVTQHQHHALLDAICSGEGARAEHLAREHARSAKRNLDIVLAHEKTMAYVPGIRLIRNG